MLTEADLQAIEERGKDEWADMGDRLDDAHEDIAALITEVKRLQRTERLATMIAKGIGGNDYGHYELAADSDSVVEELLKHLKEKP